MIFEKSPVKNSKRYFCAFLGVGVVLMEKSDFVTH